LKKILTKLDRRQCLTIVCLTIFIQPLAIWFHDKACSCAVLVNIILLFLFVIPAIIHAIWYCFMRSST
uniref:Plasma membrane proteolipid 3 n=1 Tax=Haemonchus placei TaxID=6290 RepID=A0A0N4W6A0_HAEPC